MIVNSPTGFYITVIPSGIEEGNISFTISNNPPPRSPTLVAQLPVIEEFRPSPDRIIPRNQRRDFLGDLLVNVVISGKSTGDGSEQFEIGQIIEFSDDDEQVDQFQPDNMELLQNTRVVDYEKFGINDSDYARLVELSNSRFNEVTELINVLNVSLKDNANNISKNQSDINQISALLDNSVQILGSGDPVSIKLTQTLSNKKIEKTALLTNREQIIASIESARNELNKIREVVR